MGTKRDEGQGHRFGGAWTEAKLSALKKYLHAYMQIMKKRQFRTAYIDAFAGTGWRTPATEQAELESLFPDELGDDRSELIEGSARIALRTEPAFEKFIFIERSAERCRALESLQDEFEHLSDRIRIQQGDANALIQEICSKQWKGHRAVLFLDPYGAQVEWDTLEAVADTQAIDLWLLFPLGIAVGRLLTHSQKFPIGWENRLNVLLGTEDWKSTLYEVKKETDLFGEEAIYVSRASLEEIGGYFVRRLDGIFAGVATPGVLRNSTGSPLYLLCFGVGNPNAVRPAIDIADHILKDLR